jgi:hypothetical protein
MSGPKLWIAAGNASPAQAECSGDRIVNTVKISSLRERSISSR